MAECYYCGRRFPVLYKMTAEDIQRDHIRGGSYEIACADCFDRVRLVARLVPEQSLGQTMRNFSWMVPMFSLALLTAAIVASVIQIGSFRELPVSSEWFGTGAILVGTLMVWDRSKQRYGFTHDIRWTLKSKRVNVALAVVLAGIAILALSPALPK